MTSGAHRWFWFGLFWAGWILAVLWAGYRVIGLGVGAHYHPMAALGDANFQLRNLALALPLLIGVFMLGWILWWRALTARTSLIGLALVALSASLSLLPQRDSGYEQVYWLGQQAYSIPWRYGPYAGVPLGDESAFFLRVSREGLEPIHETNAPTIVIGASTRWYNRLHTDLPEGPREIQDPCGVSLAAFSCRWDAGSISYHASGPLELFPARFAEFERFQADVEALIADFRARGAERGTDSPG